MVKCDKCSKNEEMPFRCNYCGGYFCTEHRLPEFHDCPGLYNETRNTFNPRSSSRTNYDYIPRQSKVRNRFYFSQEELKHLVIGLGVILLLPIMSSGFMSNPLIYVVSIMLVYAAAFLIHEISHKFAAQRYGYWAEFRTNQIGILLTIMSLFSPFKIVAPGAVVISGLMYGEDYGKISLAGPISNIIQAIIFLALRFVMPQYSLWWWVAVNAIEINTILAIFNLIPFGIFDGEKIIKWDWRIWLATIACAGILRMV